MAIQKTGAAAWRIHPGEVLREEFLKPMNITPYRLARRLLELRGDTPQYQFAHRLGISKSSLNRMEIGDQNVSLKTLDRLCARLRCDVVDLFPKEPK